MTGQTESGGGAVDAPLHDYLATVSARRQTGARLAAKRLLDATVAVVVLVVTSPILLVVAVAVRLDSPGPALYRGERVGFGARSFTMYKFRSMVTDADPGVHRALVSQRNDPARASADGGLHKVVDDPRVTRIGRILRRTSIDELPQLFNVLRGDMSLVGPRPDVPYALDQYHPRHWRRFSVMPGMTGLWQVSGRSELSAMQMLDLDVRYADEWTLWLDLVLLVKTVSVVATGRAA